MNDACQICLGTRGGVPGNENVIDDVVVCDYCYCTMKKYDLSVQQLLRIASLGKFITNQT
jgi:hypothetical protein